MSFFVCVEVLQPSQPNGVMSSAVSLPNHTVIGRFSPPGREHSFLEIDHEIFSTIILSLPLIQGLAKECAQDWLTA